MKVYIVAYYSKLYDISDTILCAYWSEEDAIKKVTELSFEAKEIFDKTKYCYTEESKKMWDDYTEKYGIDPYEIAFYFTEIDLF